MYDETEQILVLRDGRCQEAQPPACNPTTHARSTGVGTVRVPLPKTELRSRSCAKNDVRNTIVSISIWIPYGVCYDRAPPPDRADEEPRDAGGSSSEPPDATDAVVGGQADEHDAEE